MRKFSHYQARNLSEILPNTENTKEKGGKNGNVRPSKKKRHVSSLDFYKKRGGRIFGYLLFPIACFLYTLLPSPRDTLELLGHGML